MLQCRAEVGDVRRRTTQTPLEVLTQALLLGLTVLCGLLAWLTYQWRWIHDRHDAIAKLHIGTCVSATGITANNVPFDPYLRNLFAKRDAVAPWSLRLLGEPAVFEISVYGPDHAELAARFRRLFPEAECHIRQDSSRARLDQSQAAP